MLQGGKSYLATGLACTSLHLQQAVPVSLAAAAAIAAAAANASVTHCFCKMGCVCCAVLDIVGTGGDGIGSVNISTGACVLAAAAGAHVAKHGNRAVSSSCGAADVLEVIILLIAYCDCYHGCC